MLSTITPALAFSQDLRRMGDAALKTIAGFINPVGLAGKFSPSSMSYTFGMEVDGGYESVTVRVTQEMTCLNHPLTEECVTYVLDVIDCDGNIIESSYPENAWEVLYHLSPTLRGLQGS